LVESLPALIAIPLSSYFDESADREPKLKLWHACDAVEMLLRFLVMVALADVRGRGGLTPELIHELRSRVERPTFGRWWGMAEALAYHLDPESSTVPELRALVLEHLAPFLQGRDVPPSPDTSFFALRNQLAHGGGVTTAYAARLLSRWREPFEVLVSRVAFLADTRLIVRQPGMGLGELRGTSGRVSPGPDVVDLNLSTAPHATVLLVRGERVLPLWPLAVWGEPKKAGGERIEGAEAAQVYARSEDASLTYTLLGSDWACQAEGDATVWASFRQLFGLNAQRTEVGGSRAVRGFEDQIRRDASEVVGRGAEVARLTELLREQSEGCVWIGGQAGVGKSFVVAKVVADLLEGPGAGALVLPYRFRPGDERCSREAFLRFATERLAEWDGLRVGGKDPGLESRAPLQRLRAQLGRVAGGRRVVFVLDGLDEIAACDKGFAGDVPLALRATGVLWACAGRQEAGLPERFRHAGAVEPWPDGLPLMTEADIHEMLLEQLGPLRGRLVHGDRDDGDRVVNAFVQRVFRNAGGLPIYVRYVVNDAKGGRLSPDAGTELPPSLAAYHEKLLERCEVGDLRQVLPPLLGTLAIAREPLTAAALGDLLSRRYATNPGEEGEAIVLQALSAIGSTVRRFSTADGEEGFALFHLSFREHVHNSPRTKAVVATARQAMADAALAPGEPHRQRAARYLYRQGVSHLLEAWRTEAALRLMTSFDYSMARLRALEPGGIEGIGADWRAVQAVDLGLDRDARIWEAFFRERDHLLRRGDTSWPSYKILLQLAVEHADGSPVTKQAESWLAEGKCDWLWLRNARRSAHAGLSRCARVMEGHSGPVHGMTVLRDGRILSWSADGTLRLWAEDGEPGPVFKGNLEVYGAAQLNDGNLLSWGLDKRLRLWSPTGTLVRELVGHGYVVQGARQLPDGRILSWSEGHTLRLWSRDGGALSVLKGQGRGYGLSRAWRWPNPLVVRGREEMGWRPAALVG
jgi:hypothetical protein